MEESELQELKLKVRPLILQIYKEKKMKYNAIAKAIGASVWLVYKWKEGGKNVPNDNDTKDIVDKLENLLEKKEFEKQNKSEELEEILLKEEPSFEIGSSKLICMFLDSDGKTAIYKGDLTKLGRVTEVEGKKAFIIYEIVSTKEGVTNWVINIHDESMAPTIHRGSVIAIDKINVSDFKPGYTYCIIDSTYQVHLRKVFIENETTVKLASLNEINFPHFKLELTKIRAIFRVVDALNINP